MKWNTIRFAVSYITLFIAMLFGVSYFSKSYKYGSDNRMIQTFSVGPLAEKDSIPSPTVPRCTNQERIALLHSKCGITRTPDALLALSSSQQSKVYESIFVDLNHKLVACLPSKTGCTTWKAILVNNSRDQPLSPDFNTKRVHTDWLDTQNIIKLSHFNTTMQQFYLTSKDYFKIMVTRHPFDRLYSAYVNKFVPPSAPAVTLTHGARILQLFHPTMNKTQQKLGEGVRFREFIQYLDLPISFNLHWESVYNLCQPCLITYDEILKTETYPGDLHKIIRDHLGPLHRGFGTRHNVGAGGNNVASLTRVGRHMDAYSSLSSWQLDWLADRFMKDVSLFGYSWRKDGDSVYTSCTTGSPGKHCC